MSLFSGGQLNQLGDALQAAGWSAEDVTNLGQAGKARLIEIRDSLRGRSDIVSAIDGRRTELWLHPEQQLRWVPGRKILAQLNATGLMAGCADKADLLAIQAKGVVFFRQHFAGKAIFGWRGVEDDRVPYLVEDDGGVLLYWYHLDYRWHALYPALRRK